MKQFLIKHARAERNYQMTLHKPMFEITQAGDNLYRWILWRKGSNAQMAAITTHSYATKNDALAAIMQVKMMMERRERPEIRKNKAEQWYWRLDHDSPIAISSRDYKTKQSAETAYETAAKHATEAEIATYGDIE